MVKTRCTSRRNRRKPVSYTHLYKFDIRNVTDMSSMFSYTGYDAMTSLDLGDKFDTSKVTNMEGIFCYTGNAAMTNLDLGPALSLIHI